MCLPITISALFLAITQHRANSSYLAEIFHWSLRNEKRRIYEDTQTHNVVGVELIASVPHHFPGGRVMFEERVC